MSGSASGISTLLKAKSRPSIKTSATHTFKRKTGALANYNAYKVSVKHATNSINN